jgi:hypothetical protein
VGKRLTRLLILVLLVVAATSAVAGIVLVGLTWSVPRSDALNGPAASVGFILATFSFAVAGALIAWSRPRNPIGWLCLASAISDVSLSRYLAYTLLVEPETVLPSLTAAGALVEHLWLVPATGFVVLLIVFPRGVPSSRLMTGIAGIVVLFGVSAVALGATQPGNLQAPFERYENPLGAEGLAGSRGAVTGLTLGVVLIGIGAAVEMLMRFRRSTGDERQQFKWFAYVTGWIPPLMLVWLALSALHSDALNVLEVVFPFLLISVPIAIGIAVLRYRLYDIDALINRTLVYGLLSALLAGTYFSLVVGLQAALAPLSGGSDLAIVATTLVVAALFLPARRRVQDAVDRRFNRHAYDAARTIDAFSARLRQQIDLDTLRQALLAVVDETMQPVKASLWLRPDGREGGPT